MSEFKETSQQNNALIVKIGGSLYEHVPDLAAVLTSSHRPLFIIPGGGRFADAVRESGLPDDEAHWKAIAAMDTFGSYLASFGFDTTDQLSIPEKTTVFLPTKSMSDYDPLPHTWDVTSDTIAAWVAGRLGLDLLVLKSVDGIRNGRILLQEISQPIDTDIVDPCFIPYILDNRISATIINGKVQDRITRFLQGEQVLCTRISTTF
jgi:5-(aminomethyl)-3-furanmethanol phosphate kinase